MLLAVNVSFMQIVLHKAESGMQVEGIKGIKMLQVLELQKKGVCWSKYQVYTYVSYINKIIKDV